MGNKRVMGPDAKGLLKCYAKLALTMAIKRKNNFKPRSDMIKLCFGKIIPTAKLDGNGKILS